MGVFRIKKKWKSKHTRKTIDDDLIVTKSVFDKKSKFIENVYKPSIGEQNIIDFLKKHKVTYTREKIFRTLLNPFTKQPLRFDFFIKKLNTAIEFDGKQHFEVVNRFHKNEHQLHYQQTKDALKNEFCAKHDIVLIRVHYKDINRVSEVLKDLVA